jgi:hypothetical protein
MADWISPTTPGYAAARTATFRQVRPDGPLQIEVVVDAVSVFLTNLTTGLRTSAFSYDPPTITRVTPANIPVTGGSTISVLGLNFGPPSAIQQLQFELTPQRLELWAGATLMLNPVWTSDTSLASVGPPGSGARLNLAVTVPWFVGQKLAPRPGLRFGAAFAFSFDAPVLTTASPTNSPQTAVLGAVSVTGMNFAQKPTGATLCSPQVAD